MFSAMRSRHARALQRQARTYVAPARSLNFCVDVVKQHDRERYACNLHAPHEARVGLFALHAFNLETVNIGATTTDEAAGAMRFAWWRDTVGKCLDGRPPEHPVAQALAHAHAACGLTPRYLTQLLDAREADLRRQQPRSLGELSTYAERTAGSLLLLGLEVSGAGGCEWAERAASQAGMALGITTVLRGAASHAAQGRTYIPADVTDRHGVKVSRLLKGEASAALSDAVAEVADEATAHLLAARAMRPDLGPAARAVLLPATVADLTLARLHAHGFSQFEPAVGEPLGVRLQLELLWGRLSGTY